MGLKTWLPWLSCTNAVLLLHNLGSRKMKYTPSATKRSPKFTDSSKWSTLAIVSYNYNWIRFLKQYVPRRNQPTRIKAKETRPITKVHPPNRRPRHSTMTNGKKDLTIDALFTQRPLRKIRVAKLTTFHLLHPLQNILFRLFATKEWQLHVKRL